MPIKKGWTDITDRLGLKNTFGRRIVTKEIDGEKYPFMRMAVPDGVQVQGFTPDGLVVTITETRKDIGETYCHSVGGGIEDDESPENAAKREFLKETGYKVGELHAFGALHKDSAHLQGTTYPFVATDCVRISEPEPGITVTLMTLEKFEASLYGYVMGGTPNKPRGGGNSVITLWLYKQWLKSQRKEGNR